MKLIRLASPLHEPCSVDDLKAHMRVDGDVEYGLIQSLITAAREHIEDVLHRTLMPCEWELQFDAWPPTAFELPMAAPLRSVTSITYVDEAGSTSTWSASNYLADTACEPGRVVMRRTASAPAVVLRETGGVSVRYVAGYADLLTASSTAEDIAAARNAVPEPFRVALKLMVAHLFENREAVVVGAGLTPAQIPLGVDALLWPRRVVTY